MTVLLNIPKLKKDYVKLLTGWAENLKKEDFDFPDLEKEIGPFQDRLETLLDKADWTEADAIELCAMFFICSILPEIEEDEEDEEDEESEEESA